MKNFIQIGSKKLAIPEGTAKEWIEQLKEQLKEPELPTTWEELGSIGGHFVNDSAIIVSSYTMGKSINNSCKKVFPTREEAEAALALSQLCQLRDRYNGEPLKDWVNWKNLNQNKHVIRCRSDKIETYVYQHIKSTLTFKTAKLRGIFLENFRELIQIAKPLL